MKYTYRNVKFRPADYAEIVALVTLIEGRHDGRVFINQTILDAVRFYRQYGLDDYMAVTPGGQAQA